MFGFKLVLENFAFPVVRSNDSELIWNANVIRKGCLKVFNANRDTNEHEGIEVERRISLVLKWLHTWVLDTCAWSASLLPRLGIANRWYTCSRLGLAFSYTYDPTILLPAKKEGSDAACIIIQTFVTVVISVLCCDWEAFSVPITRIEWTSWRSSALGVSESRSFSSNACSECISVLAQSRNTLILKDLVSKSNCDSAPHALCIQCLEGIKGRSVPFW